MKYQFHHLPEHHTPGHTHSRDITWDDSHVILLGTINREFLAEYLRGPPLTMEVHDRDRCLEKAQEEAVFGTERRDELLGTHAFGTGEEKMQKKKFSACGTSIEMFLPGIEPGTLCV